MKIHYRRNSFLPLTAALALLVNHANAVTYTWDGDTSQFWSVTTNWVGGVVPVSANTTDIIISGTANVGLMFPGSVSYTIKSLTFDASNDADTKLSLQQNGNHNNGARNLTFSSDSGNATLTVDADATGNKTIDRLTTGTGSAATIILTSSLDIIHNGSGTLTLGDAVKTSVTGGGSINKSGTGTLSLPGANNYTGATNVTGGTLLINGSTSSTSLVTVDGGTLGGNGTIGGSVTVNSGGTLAPGNSTGLLTVGSLDLNASSSTILEINGTNRGALSNGYDALNVNTGGTIDLGGALLFEFGNLIAFAANTDLDLFSFDTTSTGDFTSVTSTGFYTGTWGKTGDIWSLTDEGQTLNFSEVTGNLVVIPEPRAALLGAIGLIALLRRRR